MTINSLLPKTLNSPFKTERSSTLSTRQTQLAVFLSDLGGGGAERQMLNLTKELAARGHSLDLLLSSKTGPFLADVPESVRIIDLGAKRVGKALFPLARYLRREKPAVMLSVANHVNLVALWARRLARVKTRLVVSERNQLTLWSKNSTKTMDRFVIPKLIKWFYRWADGIVAVSEGVGDDLSLQTRIPREKIHAIYNPVARKELFEQTQMPVDHPWLQPDQPPVVLAVGRLDQQKDFPVLIRAVAKVRKIRPVRLMILGEGSERSALQKLIDELGIQDDVTLHGFAANPYAYMSKAAGFVLSSRWEGLPGVLIEAMCCGVPVISTDCPSGPREILQDGKYGQLVPVGDINAIANAIHNVLDHPDKRTPRESVRRFELETVANQYEKVLFGKS